MMSTASFWCTASLLAAVVCVAGTSSNDDSSNVKAEYVNIDPSSPNNLRSGGGSGQNYVFLQKFSLENTNNLIFHTEVLVCPRDNFEVVEQKALDDNIESLTDFVEIDESWWSSRTANCVEFGYGGAGCSERCCAAPHGPDQINFPLNERRAVISNADLTTKELFLYGTGAMDGEAAYHALCGGDDKCWSNWAGTDYNPLTNNCNTFTSTVLHCVFGLSEKKPKLGPSDMVKVTCDKCPLPSAVASFF
jgi:hypothetical protein